ncbi:ubiquinone biosynthesis accessory factor UbiJ [Candidatus Spongiihabitans sp.]|uniref:ubiquinone biosynthesis accessory factor UbiJ n=1 Tax=Candidatus Spongiihabitans sp. TaxID=3101308 RepID=UPI003C7B70DE
MSAFFDFLNRTSTVLLSVDPDSKEKLAELDGKVLCIEITMPRITLFLVPANGEMEILRQCNAEADVTLTGSAMAFAKLGTAGTGSGVLSDGRVTMQGDADTGQAFQKILSQLDMDWEELLARHIGDTPARKAGNVARNFGRWASQSLDLSRHNAGEFLQEEARVLVTNLAMQRFQDSVDKLRADTDRLEQRIMRLQKNPHP